MNPQQQREIYEMATIDNLSYAAIAEAMEYAVSEDEVEQIVLSFSTKRGD